MKAVAACTNTLFEQVDTRVAYTVLTKSVQHQLALIQVLILLDFFLIFMNWCVVVLVLSAKQAEFLSQPRVQVSTFPCLRVAMSTCVQTCARKSHSPECKTFLATHFKIICEHLFHTKISVICCSYVRFSYYYHKIYFLKLMFL